MQPEQLTYIHHKDDCIVIDKMVSEKQCKFLTL